MAKPLKRLNVLGSEYDLPEGGGAGLGTPVKDGRINDGVQMMQAPCVGEVTSGKVITADERLTGCAAKYEMSDGGTVEIGALDGGYALTAYSAAPSGAKRIGVYDAAGQWIGQIPLGVLAIPAGEKKFSFGMLSDVHVDEGIGGANFKKAMTYFAGDTEVRFVCVSGDLVDSSGNYPARWGIYGSILKECGFSVPAGPQTMSDEPLYTTDTISANAVPGTAEGKRVYAISGNHEMRYLDYVDGNVATFTGLPLWREVEYGDDVFILLGCRCCYTAKNPNFQFVTEEDKLKIQSIFERNRNKRTFVLHHVRPVKLTNSFDRRHIPIEFWRHYENAVVFHGHAHASFEKQPSSCTTSDGFKSVHVPACVDHAQGYIVDVYDSGIHLRGIKFTDDGIEPVPIGTYWLDTTLTQIGAGTCPETEWVVGEGG